VSLFADIVFVTWLSVRSFSAYKLAAWQAGREFSKSHHQHSWCWLRPNGHRLWRLQHREKWHSPWWGVQLQQAGNGDVHGRTCKTTWRSVRCCCCSFIPAFLLIRPPRFFFFSVRNLRPPLVNFYETLSHDGKCIQFYNLGPKFLGPALKKFLEAKNVPNLVLFWTTTDFDREYTCISRKIIDRLWFLTCMTR